MKDALYVCLVVGLPAWWSAQAILSLRDYYRSRRLIRQLPPPTRDEVEIIARFRTEPLPHETKTLRWFLEHPRYAAAHWLMFAPVLVLFWPMAVLLWSLPPLETRLSRDAVERLRSKNS